MQALRLTIKPSKQRKMIHQAPDHKRNRLFGSPLSPELKASHGIKSVSVRSGDTVRIMRGDHKGFEGKVTRVDRQRYRIYVEGLTREKVDGSTIFVPVHPSKIMITTLNLDDKWRKQILERKKAAQKRLRVAERPPKRLAKEVAETKEKIAEERAPAEQKPPKAKRKPTRRKTVKKPAAEEAEKKTEEPKEEKPKAKKPRTRRKTAKKTEGEA